MTGEQIVVVAVVSLVLLIPYLMFFGVADSVEAVIWKQFQHYLDSQPYPKLEETEDTDTL